MDTFKFESQSKGCQGGIGDRGIAARLKNVYMIIMRPVKMYVCTNIKTGDGGGTELTILRFSLGVTRINGIRNEYMRGTDQVE